MRVMFDTNAFNAVIKGNIRLEDLRQATYFCTNLQEAEIRRTSNEELCRRLLAAFHEVRRVTNTSKVLQHSTPWESPWDSPWDRGGAHYKPVLAALESRKKGDRGNSYDAVLIETCLYESISLVSEDVAVREVATEFGVFSMTLSSFLCDDQKAL